MIIVLKFGKEVDDHFNAYLITLKSLCQKC